MTFILFAFGTLLVGLTARLLIHAIVLPRLKLSAHIRSIENYGFSVGDVEGEDSRSRLNARVTEFAERVGRFALRTVPALTPLRRGELAAAAHYDISPETVHGYRVIAAVALPALFTFYFLNNGGFSVLALFLVARAAVGGWQLPAIAIRKRGQDRLEQIDRDIPDLIDLLTATVEAGMGVAGSIGLVSGRFKGALGEELRLTIQQQSLGISNKQALEDMVERCDTPSVRAFVRTVTRGESLGVSIGPILRELATDVRRRRRQTAKEKMQKAPVKMLFPIMFLIFPALMIELMFPAGYSLLKGLGGG
jgi:tight adherence protein C